LCRHAPNSDFVRGLNTDLDFASAHGHDGDFDAWLDENPFANFAAEYKHGIPSWLDVAFQILAAAGTTSTTHSSSGKLRPARAISRNFCVPVYTHSMIAAS